MPFSRPPLPELIVDRPQDDASTKSLNRLYNQIITQVLPIIYDLIQESCTSENKLDLVDMGVDLESRTSRAFVIYLLKKVEIKASFLENNPYILVFDAGSHWI